MKYKDLIVIGIAAGGTYFLLNQGMAFPEIQKTIKKSWNKEVPKTNSKKKNKRKKL